MNIKALLLKYTLINALLFLLLEAVESFASTDPLKHLEEHTSDTDPNSSCTGLDETMQ